MRMARQSRVFKMSPYPPPVTPLRAQYVSHPELQESKRMRKFEDEDRIVAQLILELTVEDSVNDAVKNAMDGHQLKSLSDVIPLFDDPFSVGMRPVWKKNKVSLQSVFIARVVLDILDICPGYSWKELLEVHALRLQGIFQFGLQNGNLKGTVGGLTWTDKDMQVVIDLYEKIVFHMRDQTFPKVKEDMLARSSPQDPFNMQLNWDILPFPPDQGKKLAENFKNMGLRFIKPNEDLNSISNPTRCVPVP